MNRSMNDEAVYRTAPATPDLLLNLKLSIHIHILISIKLSN